MVGEQNLSGGTSERESKPTLADGAFVDEVRRFLRAALTENLRRAGRNTIGVHSDIEACRTWHRRLYEKGWIAPAWPKAYGGMGWSPAQRLIFERECADNDAPVLFAGGVRNVGPLLIALGTPGQRERYLRPILDGSDLWCQGFSEVGAGSDLATVQTRAERAGGHYIVDGSKIWTTGAHLANRMFALVRTAVGARPQAGITFLLIDMSSPGVAVKPIRSIAGEEEFCEVRFDNVRVPVADRVGPENEGWAAARLLMRFARASNTTTGLLRRAFRHAAAVANSHAPSDSDLMLALSELKRQLEVFESLELSILSSTAQDGVTDAQASMMKTLATELHQRITEAALDAAGPLAAPTPRDTGPHYLNEGAFATRKYLATRAASIYSGTNETHRNLVARSL
ncbi:MAG: acyl-CoA dehydrogenase family protein [Alphaproteobacteria bacterium]|nr:acyl-CoA dehydrogenase family protein [Alphaproteobacteria bacterium]